MCPDIDHAEEYVHNTVARATYHSLVDSIIYAFQEQTTEDQIMLDGFSTVVNALGNHVKLYLTQIMSTTILWWLNNKSAKASQRAADLTVSRCCHGVVCDKDQLLSKYPNMLGSNIAVEGAIANMVGIVQVNSPGKDLHEYYSIIAFSVTD